MRRYRCLLIMGVPKSGKTTLSAHMEKMTGLTVEHTDEMIGEFTWSATSREVAKMIQNEGPWIIEGVAAVRGLRKWIDANPGESLKHVAVFFHYQPRVRYSSQELESMAKGIITIWEEIRADVLLRGAIVFEDGKIAPSPANRKIRL
jgi:adenylate kinase family enzyme